MKDELATSNALSSSCLLRLMLPNAYGQMATLAPDISVSGLSRHEIPPGLPLASTTPTSPGNMSVTITTSVMLAVCVYTTARIMRDLQRGRVRKGK